MNHVFLFILFLISNIFSQELVIGEQRIEPGIVFIFEGAIKDHIMPHTMHLDESLTNVHIEARANWDVKDIPEGTPEGGFVAYMHITATVTNQTTGLRTFIDLLPHINLIDNFHYARNISLPGDVNDLYKVEFNILPPTHIDLAIHKDWADTYGSELMSSISFSYSDINFKEIANAKRN